MKHSAKYLAVLSALLLAACAQQEPAPIITGVGGQAPLDDDYVALRSNSVASMNSVDSGRLTDDSGAESTTYFVQPGDTLPQIAKHFRVDKDTLAARNSLAPTAELQAGQVLVIPHPDARAVANSTMAEHSNTVYQTESFTNRISQQTAEGSKPATVTAEPVTAPAPNPVEVDPTATQEAAPVVESRQQQVVEATTSDNYTYHRVGAGENLFRIGLKYNMSFIDLMAVNDIQNPDNLKAGQLLKVPLRQDTPIKTNIQNTRVITEKGPIWPVRGKVIQNFGTERAGVEYSGIAIEAPAGTPVLVTTEGNVIYASGGLASYGNLVLVRHPDGLISAYGHMNNIQVKKGDFVKKGTVLGGVGQTGNVDKPQLHFELRRNAQAIDPMKVLPS